MRVNNKYKSEHFLIKTTLQISPTYIVKSQKSFEIFLKINNHPQSTTSSLKAEPYLNQGFTVKTFKNSFKHIKKQVKLIFAIS